jgi:hypothetical protein
MDLDEIRELANCVPQDRRSTLSSLRLGVKPSQKRATPTPSKAGLAVASEPLLCGREPTHLERAQAAGVQKLATLSSLITGALTQRFKGTPFLTLHCKTEFVK